MKAQELRIGNKVTVDNPEYHPALKDRVLTVIGVETLRGPDKDFPNSTGSVRMEDDERGTYSQLDEFIKPIPLTSEWLERFGFEHRNEIRGRGAILDLKHEDWKKSFCVAQVYEGKGFCALATGRQDLTAVHQLQNLYYALCGTELTIK